MSSLAPFERRRAARRAAGIGGSFSHHDIEQIASGQRSATATEHDILATAFNEHLADQGEDHPIRYWRQLRPPLSR